MLDYRLLENAKNIFTISEDYLIYNFNFHVKKNVFNYPSSFIIRQYFFTELCKPEPFLRFNRCR